LILTIGNTIKLNDNFQQKSKGISSEKLSKGPRKELETIFDL